MEKKTKILIKRVSIFTVTLALAGGGAFMLTPNRTRTVTISGNNNNTIPVEDNDDSYFSRFVAHMTNSMDEESEESIPAIKASLEDVKAYEHQPAYILKSIKDLPDLLDK